ncbi:hypothetical protein B0H13DRAFT_2388801 [Mycena leptocephala]|nr:hypothetical protein B0H13DRAFT_2388801 [Mycena leptocephala]
MESADASIDILSKPGFRRRDPEEAFNNLSRILKTIKDCPIPQFKSQRVIEILAKYSTPEGAKQGNAILPERTVYDRWQTIYSGACITSIFNIIIRFQATSSWKDIVPHLIAAWPSTVRSANNGRLSLFFTLIIIKLRIAFATAPKAIFRIWAVFISPQNSLFLRLRILAGSLSILCKMNCSRFDGYFFYTFSTISTQMSFHFTFETSAFTPQTIIFLLRQKHTDSIDSSRHLVSPGASIGGFWRRLSIAGFFLDIVAKSLGAWKTIRMRVIL